MKRKPIDELVYETLFPRPKASDPPNFQAFLSRSLVFEVRQEVHSFYGHIDDLESRYPGLDYCHPIHRIRLSRWTWHRRLFRAFDNLGLTQAEIYGLTKWEGTKWAKERYEREQGITIPDTTADSFSDWPDPEDRAATPSQAQRGWEDSQEEADDQGAAAATVPAALPATAEALDGDESEDEVQSSVGVELNERLRLRVAAHNAGDTSQPLDEEWEQWLKNALESGELHLAAEQMNTPTSQPPPLVPSGGLFPPRFLESARAGQWSEVPDILHEVMRASIEREQMEDRRREQQRDRPPPRTTAPATSVPTGSERRRTYSALRLP